MGDPTHVYLNLDVVNNSTTTSQPLVFNETRNMPFLTNSQDYFCSVVRFTLQTSNSLPVFIPDILTGQSDYNKTVYAITMSLTQITTSVPSGEKTYTTKIKSAYIQYARQDATVPLPSPPTTRVDTSSSYYFVYNINDWVDMINLCFKQLTNELISAFSSTFNFNQPFITYDISSGLFTIHSDNSMDLIGSGGTFDLQIGFNSRLYNILPFSSLKLPNPLDTDNPSFGTIYRLNLFNKSDSNVSIIYSSSEVAERYIILQTEFSPISIMNPIRNVYFTSNTLPIQPTLVSPPKIIGDTTLSVGSVSGDLSNIIADYSIPVSSQNNYNGEIIYAPSAEYRLLSMNSAQNINRIDLNAYWESKTGQAYPIYLPSGCSANIKIMFRHIRFNLNF
jgi:hypothetical protein